MKLSQIWQEKGRLIRKMWINQFAFSLFGIFVATPFSGNICILAGIFALLFYSFVVGFAILDDSQKDRIAYQAGRKQYLKSNIGMGYSFLAFIPTIALTVIYTLTVFVSGLQNSFSFILGLINKYAICGEILGIDVGLTKYTYDAVNQIRATTAPDYVIFLSEHGILQLVFAVVMPLVFGFIYYLGFSGVISFNTTDGAKKKD